LTEHAQEINNNIIKTGGCDYESGSGSDSSLIAPTPPIAADALISAARAMPGDAR